MLELKEVSFSYEDSRILKNINLSINKGEKIALLGANGAGKTTLFLCINGVLKYKGDILYNGNKITPKELRRKVGLVFQEPDVQIIATTVEREISFGPMNMKISRDEVKQRTDRAIAELDLEAFRKRAVQYLSGGEKKRVCIADIIAMDSEIVLFDEPCAFLDTGNAVLLEGILNKMAEERTIIVSTHDMDFAYRWADRFIIMENGNIAADGGIEVFNTDYVQKPLLWQIMKIQGREDHTKYPRNIAEYGEMYNG